MNNEERRLVDEQLRPIARDASKYPPPNCYRWVGASRAARLPTSACPHIGMGCCKRRVPRSEPDVWMAPNPKMEMELVECMASSPCAWPLLSSPSQAG